MPAAAVASGRRGEKCNSWTYDEHIDAGPLLPQRSMERSEQWLLTTLSRRNLSRRRLSPCELARKAFEVSRGLLPPAPLAAVSPGPAPERAPRPDGAPAAGGSLSGPDKRWEGWPPREGGPGAEGRAAGGAPSRPARRGNGPAGAAAAATAGGGLGCAAGRRRGGGCDRGCAAGGVGGPRRPGSSGGLWGPSPPTAVRATAATRVPVGCSGRPAGAPSRGTRCGAGNRVHSPAGGRTPPPPRGGGGGLVRAGVSCKHELEWRGQRRG